MSPTTASTSLLVCSFCGKSKDDVSRLIAGPTVFICNECVGLCDQILSDDALSSFADIDDKNEDELLSAMVRLDASRNQVERAVSEHVQKLRDRGVTWARIGTALGISRQSAWERFSGEE